MSFENEIRQLKITDTNYADNFNEVAKDLYNAAQQGTTAAKVEVKNWATGTFSNPNLLINGDFQVWQRGESFSGGGYTTDRWYMYSTNAPSISKNIDGSLHWVTTGNDNLVQVTELKNRTAEKYTLSFRAKASSNVSVHLRLMDISAPQGDTIFATTTITLSSEYKVFSVSSGSHSLAKNLAVWITCYEISEIDIDWIKVELGSVATPFVPRSYGEELALCQRYALKTSTRILASTITQNEIFFHLPLPVAMRVSPTVQGAITIVERNWSKALEGYTYTVGTDGFNTLMITATKANHGMTDPILAFQGIFDAEIY